MQGRRLQELPDSSSGDPTEGHCARLVEAMAALLSERGLSTVTIADIARRARVSKRTFYEHFDDKEACFVACYEASGDALLQAIVDAMSTDAPWEKRMRASTRAYLSALESQPGLTRTLMMDIYGAGPKALRVRRRVMKRFADNLRRLVAEGRRERPRLPSLSSQMAIAIIGGINELVLVAVEAGRAASLTELANTADALLEAVLDR